jgi:Ca2+:H+ antiporter
LIASNCGALLGLGVLAMFWLGRPKGWVPITSISAPLIGSVFIAIHHAEVVAHKVGEPLV